MKKLFVLLISILLILSLSACGAFLPTQKQEESVPSSESPSVVESSEQEVSSEKVVIDIAALRAAESADTFPLSVVSAKGVVGACDNGSPVVDLNGEDGIILTLDNKTSAKIQELTVLVLCTDANGSGRSLGTLQSINSIDVINGQVVSYSNDVNVMGTKEADLNAGEQKEYCVQCTLDGIKNVNAIVYSYVDATGKEVINENYKNWLEKTTEATIY